LNSSYISHLETPIGTLEIKADEENIVSVLFLNDSIIETENTNAVIEICKVQLTEYFNEIERI
jgi:hypothetical protein